MERLALANLAEDLLPVSAVPGFVIVKLLRTRALPAALTFC